MRIVQNLDWAIITPLIIISSLGALILFSLDKNLFSNQILYFLIGIIIFLVMANIDYQIYPHFKYVFYALSLIMLLLTFLLGEITRGTVRWIRIGQFTLQTSEMVKPLLIIFFASLGTEINLNKFKNVMLIIISLIIPSFLISKQPDLGNSIVIFVVCLGIIIGACLPKKYFFIGLLMLGMGLPLGWKILKPYQQERIINFFYPEHDPLGTGYNLIQAKIAVGSGGLIGKGLGKGGQSQLRFLPERHSDFIFASLAEEVGFLGASLLLVSFVVLIHRILSIAKNTTSKFGSLISLGVGILLLFQGGINIAMNLGIAPITGITLPFVSYGGSSIISTFVLLGMVQSVNRGTKIRQAFEIG